MKNELRAKIITRAWKDEAFRNKLINSPKEALLEFGIDLPANIELKVIPEDAKHYYFVIPNPPSKQKELSIAEMEKVAGATGQDTCHGTCCTNCDPDYTKVVIGICW